MASSSRAFPLSYAIVVLFAYIGFSLPLPLLPEMFLDVQKSILPKDYTLAHKVIVLGFVMAAFPFGQFFGAPLLGHLSDRHGRKKVILASLFGTMIGYVLTALSVTAHSITGMFLGLAVCGFCEGNVTIAQSVIADLTHEKGLQEKKARYFGWINIFIAVGFIIGPLMGGQLADPNLVSWFTFATPFWIAAAMTVIGMCIIHFFSQETLKNKSDRKWSFVGSVWSGFTMPSLKIYYIANFFLALGYFSYFRFLPVFLERYFDFTAAELGYVMVYDAVAMGLGVIFLLPSLARRFSAAQQLWVFSILLAISFIVCIIPNNPYMLIITIPPAGLFLAVTITNGSLVISDKATLAFQGQALGTLTSVQVLAEFLTGALGGFMAAKMTALPLYIGALMSVMCGVVLLMHRIRNPTLR